MSKYYGRKLYRIYLFLIGLAAVIGTVVIACTSIESAKTDRSYLWCFGFAVAMLVILPLNTVVHEAGHLVFGWLSGMKFSSIRFNRVRIVRIGNRVKVKWLRGNEVAGSCEMYPGSTKNVRGRMIVYSLGGDIFNLAYGVFFVVSCFVFPLNPALYFFQLFAPLNLLEAAASLYPTETATGKTDGEVVRGLLKKDASSVVALHVLTAQGVLSRGSFSGLDRGFLFDTPVVREDETAFLALVQLRYQYLFYHGEDAEALDWVLRMQSLLDYLPEINRPEIACDLVYAFCVFKEDLAEAEMYLSEIAGMEGSCAYYRAMAAYDCLKGEDRGMLSLAERAASEEPIAGIAELEQNYLSRLKK